MASQIRRDSKHRVLRRGESQRKDGKYMFKWQENGKPKIVMSWRLEPTDKQPIGTKPTLSLREMEKQIGKDLDSQLDPLRKNMTVKEWFIVTMKSTEFRCQTSPRTFAAILTAVIWPELE